jgi:beta-phosphoglucomutase
MFEMEEALVFDYDGVIADTEPLHWRSWAALLERYGIQLGWEEYCRIGRGVSDTAIFERFREQMTGLDAGAFSRLNQERKDAVREWSLAERPIPSETVASLNSLGAYRVGLVTSSERAEVEPVLRSAQLYGCFDAMVFGEEPSAPKPSPAPYLLIAERLGVKTGVAFEDSEPGMASASAAGFRAIKVDRPQNLSQIVSMWLR